MRLYFGISASEPYREKDKMELNNIIKNAHGSIENRIKAAYNLGKKDGMSKWIPVKERLPERAKIYLVSGGGKVWICQFLDFGEIKGWANDARNPIVEAWRECPEPYREDGTE